MRIIHTKEFEDAVKKWKAYIFDIHFNDNTSQLYVEKVWEKHFADLPCDLLEDSLKEMAKYIHKSYFHYSGKKDVYSSDWERVEKIYCQMLMASTVIGYYTFNLQSEDFKKMRQNFYKSYSYFVDVQNAYLQDKVEVWKALNSIAPSAFKIFSQKVESVLDSTVKFKFSSERNQMLLVRLFLFGFFVSAFTKNVNYLYGKVG